MAEGWRSVTLDQIEPIPVVGGTLLWRPVRRMLDIGAFGINSYVGPNAGDDVVEEHTEQSLGHEEVYVVLSGHATFTLDGKELDAPAGTVVFIRDPTVRRHAKATEPNTVVPAVGGPRGAAYEPSAWEDYFAAERHRNAGDYDAYADELAEALEQRPRANEPLILATDATRCACMPLTVTSTLLGVTKDSNPECWSKATPLRRAS